MKLQHATVQTILSILALAISVLAALFAWQQVEVSRTHNRISVSPLLHVTPYAEGKTGRSGIYLSNVGLGPATIVDFSASAGFVEVSGFEADRWSEVLKAAGVNPLCFATGWPRSRAAVKAGDELALVSVTKAEGFDNCHGEMIKLMGGSGVQVSIKYQSVYGDSISTSGTTKVNSATFNTLYRALTGK